MADTASRVYGPAQPSNSNGTLYTSTGVTTIVRNMHAANCTSADATLTLAVNGTSATASNCYLYQITVPALGTYDWSGFLVMASGETLQGQASAASTITLTVSGITY